MKLYCITYTHFTPDTNAGILLTTNIIAPNTDKAYDKFLKKLLPFHLTTFGLTQDIDIEEIKDYNIFHRRKNKNFLKNT